MKKFNRVILLVIAFYILMVSMVLIKFNYINNNVDSKYKVEINRLYLGLVKSDIFTKPDLSSYDYIKDVSYININSNINEIKMFYEDKNKKDYVIKPWIYDNTVKGYFRFDVIRNDNGNLMLQLSMVILFISFIIIIFILLYIKFNILKPFNILSNVAYEISKGNLKGEIKENRNRYFGKFIWGINLLRDNLDYHKVKELKLEKEKKMLLLSISHDIKTPLNSIKLYAKAIENKIYDSEDKQIEVAKQIQDKTIEIDSFINEIIKTSSEDILEIEVNNSEFYLKDLIDKVKINYKEKCNLRLLDLKIERFSNKIIKGDIDRTYEVIGNILENAFKYGDGREIIISFYEEDYCQLIKIFNSGDRVPQNELIHLFDSFYRGSNVSNKEGNGLGLYICKYIMEKMDGEIFAQCEDGGMSFTLVLTM